MIDKQGLITQMRKGAVEYCVLALLAGRERYGYELVQALSRVDGMLVTEGSGATRIRTEPAAITRNTRRKRNNSLPSGEEAVGRRLT